MFGRVYTTEQQQLQVSGKIYWGKFGRLIFAHAYTLISSALLMYPLDTHIFKQAAISNGQVIYTWRGNVTCILYDAILWCYLENHYQLDCLQWLQLQKAVMLC